MKLSFFIPTFLAVSIVMVLWVYQVDITLTEQDKTIFGELGFTVENIEDMRFQDQIAIIQNVQETIFREAPKRFNIKQSTPREPYDLIKGGTGHCGDKARTLEKALRWIGFETRFITVYENPEHKNMLEWVFVDDVESHALVAVNTLRGWTFIDSLTPFIAIDDDDTPISISELKDIDNKTAIHWASAHNELHWILKDNFSLLYGIYSRHGRFYPPYTSYIPDIYWPEFLRHNASCLFSFDC